MTNQELAQGLVNAKISTDPTLHPSQIDPIKPKPTTAKNVTETEKGVLESRDAMVDGSNDAFTTVDATPRQRQSPQPVREQRPNSTQNPRPGSSPGPSALIPTWTSLSQLRDQLPTLPLDALPTTLWMCHRYNDR